MTTPPTTPPPGTRVGTEAGSHNADYLRDPRPDVSHKPAQPSVGELFTSATEHMTTLVRDEIQLTKVQAVEKGKRLGTGIAGFAVAGVVALYALGILLLAAVWALALVLPLWASALIVGVVLLVIAGIAALVGKKKLDAAKEINPKPQEGLKADVDAVKKGIAK